ncbi:hypothetical protein KOR42_50110 [Thalassoglobus neptunius]|uniref:Uncharacterized protein n=1 Tax=Thalassoglobus neptunius TaxID=1938619 RepID=A0A5C5VN39_9PLAN|nr:hypothetical protein KOR42_50110 [Thalassoglobus neptunius]
MKKVGFILRSERICDRGTECERHTGPGRGGGVAQERHLEAIRFRQCCGDVTIHDKQVISRLSQSDRADFAAGIVDQFAEDNVPCRIVEGPGSGIVVKCVRSLEVKLVSGGRRELKEIVQIAFRPWHVPGERAADRQRFVFSASNSMQLELERHRVQSRIEDAELIVAWIESLKPFCQCGCGAIRQSPFTSQIAGDIDEEIGRLSQVEIVATNSIRIGNRVVQFSPSQRPNRFKILDRCHLYRD